MSTAKEVPARGVGQSELSPILMQRLANYLKKATGLSVDAEKQYLIESKLRPILQRERLIGFTALVDAIEKNPGSRLADQVAQAMTINETHFFRDRVPFDTLKSLIPSLLARGRRDRPIRIWSAACSTGQELYSIAMLLEEMGGMLAGFKVDLIGTDISESVIGKARKGAYSQFDVQRGLPTAMLLKYFERTGDDWVIAERMRKRVSFQRLNLLDNLSPLGLFDVVFCRNVLFYFEPATRTRILTKIAGVLRPEGCIALGASEGMTALAARFRPIAPGSCFYNCGGTAGGTGDAPGLPGAG